MKVIHNGHEITVEHQPCLAGYELVYYTVVRVSDLWYRADSFTEEKITVPDMVKRLRGMVDEADEYWPEEEDDYGEVY